MAKYQNHLKPGTTLVKSPIILRNETTDRITAVRRRLDEIRLYKRLIAADGQVPDQEDKRLESELIIRLLRLEKSLKPQPATKKKPEKPEATTKPGRNQRLGRRSRGS